MKKSISLMIALIAIICCAQSVSAQQRTKVANGIYIALYGNVAVVENNNTQQTIQIKVSKSDGIYEVLCGNTVVRRIAKDGLKEAINSAFKYVGLDGWLTKSTTSYYIDKYYQNVCNYLR